MTQGWSHFHHQADIGVRGTGSSLAEAFEQAAKALTAVITDPSSIVDRQCITLACEAADEEYLLVDWLNELVFLMATRHLLFGHFSVTIDGTKLTAKACGEPVDVARHQPAVEIKGATLTALRVAQQPDGQWLAECVVDV